MGHPHHVHIWTEQSKPIMAVIVVERPTKVAVPALFHPPALLNSRNTECAEARGAITHSGIMMANRPTTWMIKIKPSIMGSLLARKVLKRMEKVVIAMTRRVPCQRSNTYVAEFRTIRPCMMVPAKKAIDTIAHCHPVAQSHPIEARESQCMGKSDLISYQLCSLGTSDNSAGRILTPSDIARPKLGPFFTVSDGIDQAMLLGIYMDAISAILAKTSEKPMQTAT